MYTILVPLDDDVKRAQRQTEFLTGLSGDPDETRVVLTHVMEGEEQKAPDAMRRVDRIETVRQSRDSLEETSHNVEVSEAGSPPADGILDLADDIDADLVVMGGRKRSPAGKVLFGSVTQSVLLNTDRTVAVTGRHE